MNVIDMLAGGDRRSIGKSKEAARQVLHHPELLDEVMAGLMVSDAVIRSRCAHVLTMVCEKEPSLLQPYKQDLLDTMAPQEQWEVRQQFAKIFPMLELDGDDVARAIKLFQGWLEARQSIVRTYALQGLADLIRFDEGLKEEVGALLGHYAISGTAAMRARCRILLKQL